MYTPHVYEVTLTFCELFPYNLCISFATPSVNSISSNLRFKISPDISHLFLKVVDHQVPLFVDATSTYQQSF